METLLQMSVPLSLVTLLLCRIVISYIIKYSGNLPFIWPWQLCSSQLMSRFFRAKYLSLSYLCLGFNSLLAYASVNHLHFHLWYSTHRLYASVCVSMGIWVNIFSLFGKKSICHAIWNWIFIRWIILFSSLTLIRTFNRLLSKLTFP